MKTGRGSKARIIQLDKINEKLPKELPNGITAPDFLKSLCDVHALTGCDSVSAFSGKEKGKAFQLMMKKERFSGSWLSLELSDETLKNIEKFVCKLYGKKGNDMDLLRYDLYCAKGG